MLVDVALLRLGLWANSASLVRGPADPVPQPQDPPGPCLTSPPDYHQPVKRPWWADTYECARSWAVFIFPTAPTPEELAAVRAVLGSVPTTESIAAFARTRSAVDFAAAFPKGTAVAITKTSEFTHADAPARPLFREAEVAASIPGVADLAWVLASPFTLNCSRLHGIRTRAPGAGAHQEVRPPHPHHNSSLPAAGASAALRLLLGHVAQQEPRPGRPWPT